MGAVACQHKALGCILGDRVGLRHDRFPVGLTEREREREREGEEKERERVSVSSRENVKERGRSGP